MEKILDVAQYIFDKYKECSGETIDEMKMHKLLYFAQREHYAILSSPLFDEDFEGWQYGPVSPNVRSFFTKDGINYATDDISPESAYIINNVIEEYGKIESWKLSELTHKELSWINARKGLAPKAISHKILNKQDILKDAEKIRPYDHILDMYYDEFDNLEDESL